MISFKSMEVADSRHEKPDPAEDSDGLDEEEDAEDESDEMRIGSSSSKGKRTSSSQSSRICGVGAISLQGCSMGSPVGWYSGEFGAYNLKYP